MKGDFTRGFQPDQSRGKRYRRVLLQQGRVLLDSDHAALVDATDRSLRELAVDLGCKAGSPDYGYIVTPGVLRRLFDSLGGITTDANTTARLDYEHRYLDRFPSLYLEGSGASQGVVTIELIANAEDLDRLVVWVRSEVATNVGIKRPLDGLYNPLATSSSSFERVVLGFGETDTVQIQLQPGERLWIGMIETQSSALEPSFSIAAGRYYLGGLVLENPSIAAWPEQAFVTPTDTPFTPLSSLFGGPFTHVLAYVEGWERLHTQHQDPGIREEALGGELDTTVRSEVVGQVKIVPLVVPPLSSVPSWDELAAAFAAPFRGDGELNIDIAAAIVDPDPCAVPVDGGYTGRDNRLYRFEVHAADGSLATTRIKWSRDNGSELFPIVSRSGAEVTVAATTDLRDGDLVEVLSEIIELGDEVDAALISGTLISSKRMVGELAVLVEQEPDSLGRPVFRLGQVDAPELSVTLPAARYGASGADASLLRRWHGLIDGADGATQEIEDGIGIALSGSVFEVGSWWTYEARTLQQNANGDWKSSPHGPERRFAPLAIFELPANVDDPLELSGWADDRFSSLCSTNADDIPYDGAGVCSDADTVQEALDELFRKTGCCEVKFSPCHPSQIPDDQLIAELIQRELPNGGVLCLAAGVYTFEDTLDVAGLGLGGELTIHGCAGTIIQAAGNLPLFLVNNGASLTLEHVILVNADGGTATQVQVVDDGSRLVAHDVAFVVNAAGGAAIADDQPSIVNPSPSALLSPLSWPNPPSPPSVGVDVELRQCTILAGQGLRFNVVNRLLVDRCNIRTRTAAVSSLWIVDARITESRLSTALNLGADIPSVAMLVSHPRDALAIAANMSVVGFGATLTAVTILAGHIVGNQINGATGVFVDRLWTSDILDNQLRTVSRGLLVNQAYKSQIAGNRIASQLHGVQINFAARQSMLAGNHIAAAGGGGIELCALVQGSSLALDRVEVCDNQVFANTHALHVGPTASASGECIDVLISGNTIDFTESGSGVGVRLSRFASEFQALGLSFVGNHVHWASTCVLLRGAGVVVGENRISLEGGSASAVVANDAADAVIRGNLIELLNAKSEDTVGIEVNDCPSVVIRDNHVHQPSDPVEVRSLQLQSFGHVAEVIGNRLTLGKSFVGGGDELRFVGNQLLGSVEIKSVIHGEVSGNYAEGVFDFEDEFEDAFIDSILIHEAEGAWRVCDNRCPNGALRLIPVGDGQLEIAYRAVVTDNFIRILQVGWLGDVTPPLPPDTNMFEQNMMSASSNTRVIVTENLCGDRILINDYTKGSIRSHNIANVYHANVPAPLSEVAQPNVKP